MIAKVNAEAENSQRVATDQEIRSYPTIKFFPRGSNTPKAYTGARTEDAFIEYINKNAGTHRVAGGGLDDKAGTIEALDDLVAQYASGESLAKVAEEIKAVAKDLKHKYASYYVRVVGKLGENAGYVKKELVRLEKILAKGGLAGEKLDDLVSRSNILRKFQGDEEKDVKDEL